MRKLGIAWGCLLAAVGLLAGGYGWAQAAPDSVTAHRVYSHLLEPREHPQDERRYVKPPSWETFKHRTQFVTLRGFGVENNRLTGYSEELEKYTRTYRLGDVIWPTYTMLFAENLGDLAAEIKKRDLYLFDIWGYVPGSGPGGYWTQYRPSPETFRLLETTLGERWLGMDVGEQDGRYIGGYASQMTGISEDRTAQYLNFHRHFEKMGDDLGNRLSTLVSLNFGHYFLKEGLYTTIGAETAQALPNSQVYYSFIRGAGKQYGVPWFGNASVYNRWGYKAYGTPGPDHSATKGSSLNLLKRLMYSHIMYNSVFVGFESGWFDGEQLSPIGRIQQSANQWMEQNGMPGVMLTPAALLMDFYCGWSFPRHLYTDKVYRVWGNIPYGPGDYLTDGVLDLLYPGYQDASYFHDETGFLTATPYGDIADCLLSDAPSWLLDRYPLLIAAGELSEDPEVSDKLTAYVSAGGHLVITAGNLKKFPQAFPGYGVSGAAVAVAAGASVAFGPEAVRESAAWTAYALQYPAEARVLAHCDGRAAAVEGAVGDGRLTVIASAFGIPSESQTAGPLANAEDQAFQTPYPLLSHVQRVLDGALREQALFEAGEGLHVITCRKAPGEYTLAVLNNGLSARPFALQSHTGPIQSVRELPLDVSEKGAVGHLPEGYESAALGQSDGTTIAGGDVRVFVVQVQETGVTEIAHVRPEGRPRGRLLPIRGTRMLQEEILLRPTFFDHFDGVILDAHYLILRSVEQLQRESGWLSRQGLRIVVDLSSSINLYPDLRLIDNDAPEYARSRAAIAEVLEKMRVLGARDLVLTAHRTPENNFTGEQSEASFLATLQSVCAEAAARDITVYLRTDIKAVSSVEAAGRLIDAAAAPNLRLAASTALLLHQRPTPESIAPVLKEKLGLWLVSGPERDVNGALWSIHAPVAEKDSEALESYLQLAPDTPMALDTVGFSFFSREKKEAKKSEDLAKKSGDLAASN